MRGSKLSNDYGVLVHGVRNCVSGLRFESLLISKITGGEIITAHGMVVKLIGKQSYPVLIVPA
jgi:hypothetical protein